MASEQSAAGYVDCLAYLACLINHRSLLGLSVLPHGVLGVLLDIWIDHVMAAVRDVQLRILAHIWSLVWRWSSHRLGVS